jgi:hypothetical protein
MEILKTMVFCEENGRFYLMDTVEYEDNWWIALKWINNPSAGQQRPSIIIKPKPEKGILDMIDSGKPCDFRLPFQVPKSLAENGEISDRILNDFYIVENPKISLPIRFE